MEDYKGFIIDTDSSDHNVTVIHKELKIKEVFGTPGMARAFIDGFEKCKQILIPKIK